MNKKTADLNAYFAKKLIKELIHQGVRTFCISPGSRTAPLTIAAAEHPLASTFVHYDERGSAFHALGFAKGSESPVAIITTGGTAVGNLLPAVIEASYGKVPLILLTADRPPELRDTGARQTIDQVRIFQNFVRYQIDLPPPSAELPPSYFGTTIASAISHATSPPMGPVHINCMLREPFFPHEAIHPSPSHRAETLFIPGKKTLSPKQIQLISEEFSEQKKGVILVSHLPTCSNYESLYTLSNLLGWPIFPTLPSPLRSFGFGNGLIPYYDLILSANGFNEDFSLDAVLQFGDCYASKKFLSWIEFKKPKLYIQVSADLMPADPNRAITHRVVSDPLDFCDKLSTHLLKRPLSNWLALWQELGESTEEGLFSFFEKNKMLSEAHIFHHLSFLLKEHTPLFLAISMTIREADLFFSPKKKIGTVYANRGVSGIDGNIATSIGLARALKKPFLSILGDLAFLHDLNSLSQLSSLEHPICFIVFNNGGGGIFSALSELKKQDSFGKFFKTPHHLKLCHVAPLFGLEYIHLTNLEELPKALERGEKQHALIEIPTCAEKTYALHDEIFSYLKEVHQSTSMSYSAL